jgi:hypothetical protein
VSTCSAWHYLLGDLLSLHPLTQMAKHLESNPVCCGLWGCRCSGAGATPMCTQRGGRMAFIPFYAQLQRVSCDPRAADLRASTHPWVVKIGCNVVMSKFFSDPVIERHHQRMCHLEQAIRHPVLAISHIFEGSHLAHAPLAVPPFIPPTSPCQARQSTIDGIFRNS